MPPAAEPERSGDIARLLFKAAKHLPDEEQHALVEYFLERGLATQPGHSTHVFGDEALRSVTRGPTACSMLKRTAMEAHLSEHKVMRGDQVTIPVRLSQAQHQRLKQWCARHEFPMAVVVRGLIDRFLDEWDKPAGESAPTA